MPHHFGKPRKKPARYVERMEEFAFDGKEYRSAVFSSQEIFPSLKMKLMKFQSKLRLTPKILLHILPSYTSIAMKNGKAMIQAGR